MPEVSRFYGIVISMNFWDHAPPHFHASYGSQEASVAIRDPQILEGRLSPRARRLVLHWARLHQDEILAHWAWAQNPRGPQPPPILPLE